jgi:nucleoside-diphosphate-sugar epimerase
MRVFVAGATGAIGRQWVPRLAAAGHEVHGMTPSDSKQAMLSGLGAVPVIADALDPEQVAEAVGRARPDVIVHQLTALAGVERYTERDAAPTNRLRTEGTDYLLAAGQAVGVRRFVAQGVCAYGAYARSGGPVKREEDPLEGAPVREMRETLAAIRHLEAAVLGARWTERIVLRYGAFYGPVTSLARGEEQFELVRKRKFRWSATVAAYGLSSTSPRRRRRRWRRSSTAAAVSTTWSTMIPPRSRIGCRHWRRRWARRSRCACRGSSGGCSRERPAW